MINFKRRIQDFLSPSLSQLYKAARHTCEKTKLCYLLDTIFHSNWIPDPIPFHLTYYNMPQSHGISQRTSKYVSWNILSAAVMADENQTSALFRRHEQLKRWHESDTHKCLDVPSSKPKRVKFQDGCIFLAACSSGDREEVKKLLDRGADINTANIDGLTALHQVYLSNGRAFEWIFQKFKTKIFFLEKRNQMPHLTFLMCWSGQYLQ